MVALILAIASLAVAGWQIVIDRSDSMRPTLRAGDLLLLRPVGLGATDAGDILTFPNPRAQDRTLTHRLVIRTDTPDGFTVQTKGDANTASETWPAPRDAVVHQVAVRVPHVGRAVAALGLPLVRACAITGLIAIFTVTTLRRVWRTDQL